MAAKKIASSGDAGTIEGNSPFRFISRFPTFAAKNQLDSMKKLQSVIFDLDGTIADTLPLCVAAFKKSIEPLLKAELTTEAIVATFGPSEEGTIRQLIPSEEEQGLKAYLKHYQELHHMCPAPFPGISEVLELLQAKSIPLAMVTGKGSHSARLSLKQFGLEKYFGVLETGSPDGPDKVNGIRRVLERLEAAPAQSIYVGDSPSDIHYCREIGIPIVAAAWASTAEPEKLRPLHPDWLFYTVDDFRSWITERL